MRNRYHKLLMTVLFLALVTTILASTRWYVDGSNGNDINSCTSSPSAYATIGRAISLASSGDSIES
jgi:hypothetical protein